MIVARLAELADHEGLADDLAFEPKRVHALLHIDLEGRLLGVLPQLDLRGHVRTFVVPAQQRRTQGVLPYFLCDTIEYVLGTSIRAAVGTRRLRQMNEAFRAQVGRAADETGDAGLRAIAAFYDVPTVLPDLALSAGARIGFLVQSDEAPAFARPAAIAWWRAQQAVGAPDHRRCVVTGNEITETVMAPVWHLPRAHMAGAALMPHNLPSACSYGWAGHDNAPVSSRVATASARALDHLLHGGRPTRDHIALGCATAVVWAHGSSTLTDALRTFWNHGSPLPDEAAERVDLLVLGAETTRAIVRSFDELDVAIVRKSVSSFVELTAIETRTPHTLAPRELVRALCPRGDGAYVPASAAIDLFRAVFTGEPPSWRLLGTVLARCLKDRAVRHEHVALIRFYFERRRLTERASEDAPMKLDNEKSHLGYRLGRAFALLEMFEDRHHRCELRHRHYQAASIRPAATLPGLIRAVLSRDDGTPLADELGRILAPIEEMPKLLSLEDQGQFALGYFHERQAA